MSCEPIYIVVKKKFHDCRNMRIDFLAAFNLIENAEGFVNEESKNENINDYEIIEVILRD